MVSRNGTSRTGDIALPTDATKPLPILTPAELPSGGAGAKPRCVGCVRTLAVLDVLLVVAVFYLAAGRLVPDANEAHYLTKAKHFWQPNWIQGDQFLDSADSHIVFYATFGWLTAVLPLETAAWCGRFAIWALLAIGWRRLCQNFAAGFGWAALTAAAAVALNTRLHMSGEWFVGGCEAKGVAYALVFWGLADMTAGRWNRAFIALGAASAFHVLVGGWSVFAAGVVLVCDRRAQPAWRHCVPGLCAGGLIALAGVVPGLLLSRGADPASVAIADQTYVFERLAHHLWTGKFFESFGLRQIALWGVWGLIAWFAPTDGPRRRLRWFTLAAIGVAGCGLAISFSAPQPTPWAAAILKFYWFRLADVATAIAVPLEAAAFAAARPVRSVLRNLTMAALLAVGAFQLATVRQEITAAGDLPRGEGVRDAATLEYWRDVCRWIKLNTPRDALVLSPREHRTFKWYAERPEYFTWKDIPQDARSLVEWKTRLTDLYRPFDSFVNYIPEERIRDVCRKYGIKYIVTYQEPPLNFRAVYGNGVFVVYAVDQP